MAYQKPRGEASWRGRSRSAADEDGKRLEALRAYLPNVGGHVQGHVASRGHKLLLTALGCEPADITTHLAEVLGGPKAEEFSARVAKVLAEDARPEVDHEFVGTEAKRAEIELVRAWVNLVLGRASSGDDVVIGTNGLPVGPEGELAALPSALVESLALDQTQASEIYEGFFRNLSSAAAEGPVLLPRDLELVKDRRGLVVRQTDRA